MQVGSTHTFAEAYRGPLTLNDLYDNTATRFEGPALQARSTYLKLVWSTHPGPASDRLVPDILLVVLLEGLRRVPEGQAPPPLVRVISLSDVIHGGPQILYGYDARQAVLVRHMQSYLLLNVDERLPPPPAPLSPVRCCGQSHRYDRIDIPCGNLISVSVTI